LLDENTVKKNRKKKCNEGDNTTNEKDKEIQNRDYENIVETHKTVNKKIKIYEDRLRARRIETKKKMKNEYNYGYI
jgi:hypothetical protein